MMLTRSRAFVVSRLSAENGVLLAAGGILLVLSLYPASIILRKSVIGAGGQLSLDHFFDAFTDDFILYEPLWNSLQLSGIATILALLMAYPLAFLVSRTDMPGRRIIATLLIGPYIVPSYALSMAWVLLFSTNGIFENLFGIVSPIPPYGFWPMILVTAVHLFPFAFILLANAMATLNPELFESARIHGAGRWYMLRRVTIPMLLPATLAGGVLVFAYVMAEFAPAMLLGTPEGFYVLTTQIWSFATVYPTDFSLAAVLCLVLIVVTFVFLQTNNAVLGRRRFTTIGGNLAQPERVTLGKWRYAAFGYCILFLLATLILPIICILFGALLDLWGKGWGPSNWTLRNFVDLWEDSTYMRSIFNVVMLGFIAGFLAVVLGAVISYFIMRGSRQVSRFLEGVSFIPFIMPGVVIGVGLILGFSRPPLALYGTIWILVVGYVIRFLPLVVSSCKTAIGQIDEQLEEASRIFGATWLKAQAKILLPLLRSPLLGAVLLVFVSVMKEVSMASLVWSPGGAEVAPVLALIAFADGQLQEAVTLSFVMVVLVILGTFVAVRLGAVRFVQVGE